MASKQKSKTRNLITLGFGFLGLLFSGTAIFLGLGHPNWQELNLCQWSYPNGTAPPCCEQLYCLMELPFCPQDDFSDCLDWAESPESNSSSPPRSFFLNDRQSSYVFDLSLLARLRADFLIWNITTDEVNSSVLLTFGKHSLSTNNLTKVPVGWNPKDGRLIVSFPDGPAPGFPLVVFANIISEGSNFWSWLIEYSTALILFSIVVVQRKDLNRKWQFLSLGTVLILVIFLISWSLLLIPGILKFPSREDSLAFGIPLAVVLLIMVGQFILYRKHWLKLSLDEYKPWCPVLISFLSLLACVWSPCGGMAANILGLAMVCLEIILISLFCSEKIGGYSPIN